MTTNSISLEAQMFAKERVKSAILTEIVEFLIASEVVTREEISAIFDRINVEQLQSKIQVELDLEIAQIVSTFGAANC
jgi:hypothetical protein